MVIVEFCGGLGNQLFQYAFALNLANKLNTELKLSISAFDNMEINSITYENHYGLSIFNLKEEIIAPDSLTIDDENKTANFNGTTLKILSEEDHSHFMSDVFNQSGKDFFVRGCWHSEKYFVESADQIRENLKFHQDLGLTSKYWKEKIQSEPCAVALHIRRSSYNRPLFRRHSGILSAQYYRECVEEMKKYVDNFKVFIFSHELNWARQNLKLDVPVEYVEGCEEDADEMYLMSLCQHNIIANSTFSWWAAWLNENPNKKIFAPKLWHLDNWGGDFLVPQNWLRVPSNFEEFPPLLSIIIYVENNASTIEDIIKGALMPDFPDFEIIVVTKFGDASGKNCHGYAHYANLTILKINKDADKAAAWNKGLDCSNGEYVIFLTGRDYIFPNTVFMVGQSWDFGAQKYSKRDNYMTDENYDKIAYDIICGANYFVEHPQGNVTLEMNDNKFKKMFLIADESLAGVTEYFAVGNFDDEAKMLFAFSQSLKSIIETKIFKRKFLKKHNLYFRENCNMSENLFLVDSILLTDQILFASKSFLCRLNDL